MDVAGAEQGPAEGFQEAGERVEHVDRSQPLGHDLEGVGDGAGVEEELEEDGDDVLKVAIADHEGRCEERDAGRQHDQEEEPDRQEQQRIARLNVIEDHQDNHQPHGHGKIHQCGGDGGKGKEQPGEVNLGDELGVLHDDGAAFAERAVEGVPPEQAGVGEEEIGNAVAVELGDAAEDESEDASAEERLKDDPDDAEGGLFVAEFDIAFGEGEEKIAELPHFAEIDAGEAGTGPDFKKRLSRWFGGSFG